MSIRNNSIQCEESKLGEVLKGIKGFPLKLREKLGGERGLKWVATREIRGGIAELLQKAVYRTPKASDGKFGPIPRTKERSGLYSLSRVAEVSHHLV